MSSIAGTNCTTGLWHQRQSSTADSLARWERAVVRVLRCKTVQAQRGPYSSCSDDLDSAWTRRPDSALEPTLLNPWVILLKQFSPH